MPKIFDNIENFLVKGLHDTLDVSNRSDFCVGYFNLRGWHQVATYIEKFGGDEEHCCRLLVGMHRSPSEMLKDYYSNEDYNLDNATAVRLKKDLAQEFKDQLMVGIPTDRDEQALQKLAKQIKAKKVVVKLFLKHTLHAKLYLCYREDKINPIIGYLGSSNLTLAGLSKQGELNVDVLDQDAACKLSKWFEDRWTDRWCVDISNELVDIIETSWASEMPFQPYHIYLKIAYHLSREARSGLTEFKIPYVFENDLLDFQKKAVLIAAHHLNKRNGVLIGDVVGLGKTMTASALARIFEDDFYLETLIICPKNITRMWEDYVHKYQLRAKILSISVVQSKLAELRRYRLVIIDESHNLRNRDGKRYRAIKEYIRENASKVILLSATPYNKTYTDLSNQLRLFIEDDEDIGISPENFIESIGGKTQFIARYQAGLNTLSAFDKSNFADDWRELMRLYLVRRTRSFIKDNYSSFDEKLNRKYLTFADGSKSYFPDRIPKKVEFDFNEEDPADQYAKLYSEKVVNSINSLNLPRYGLANYLIDSKKSLANNHEKVIIENLSRAGKRLMGFARTNLFKRLESSGYAFLLSLTRHILRNYIFIYAIDSKLPIPIGAQESNDLDEFLDDMDFEGNGSEFNSLLDADSYYELAKEVYLGFETYYKNKFDWLNNSFFDSRLKSELIEDSRILISILNISKDWNPVNDRKLNALFELCTKKHAEEKILIFTQYADTAQYLFEQLKARKLDPLEIATGQSEDPTYLAYRFSPQSNTNLGYRNSNDEIRILITTDVLSEGQNLQDAHIIVNYDLPWAIIRLIQRAGRVDRIGQKSEQILCYSFLPEDGVERIIGLRRRLRNRINENAEVVGSDETFFEGDPINIQDLYNEKAGILDDEDSGEVDLASYAFQIWKNALDKDPSLQKIIPDLPNVVYSTKEFLKENGDELKNSVIVYAKTPEDNDALALVNHNGEIITQSQLKVLKAAECLPDSTPLEKLNNHHVLVKKGVEFIKNTESSIGGQLGKKTGARYRVYMRLTRYYEENKETLFINDSIKKAIEDIYKYPLKELARDIFNRQLKAGISDSDLAALAASLREEDKLCIIEEEYQQKQPQIICSMGLKMSEP